MPLTQGSIAKVTRDWALTKTSTALNSAWPEAYYIPGSSHFCSQRNASLSWVLPVFTPCFVCVSVFPLKVSRSERFLSISNSVYSHQLWLDKWSAPTTQKNKTRNSGWTSSLWSTLPTVRKAAFSFSRLLTRLLQPFHARAGDRGMFPKEPVHCVPLKVQNIIFLQIIKF